jgi:hypothetical protein
VGVQEKVWLVDQFCPTVEAEPSDTHHLYWYGARPPVAVVVNVIVFPARTCAGAFDVRPVAVSGREAADVDTSLENGLRRPASL